MLKYLFTATFEDGTYVQQTEQDISPTNPEKSPFWDVLQNPAKLIKFELSNGHEYYAVNLLNGEFNIRLHGSNSIFPAPKEQLTDFRVIYFRRTTLSFNLAFQQNGQAAIEYHIGWQANDANGKNVQQTLVVT
jgi:hypothetical protein